MVLVLLLGSYQYQCLPFQQDSTISTLRDIGFCLDNSVPKGLFAQLVLVNVAGYRAFQGKVDDMEECEQLYHVSD